MQLTFFHGTIQGRSHDVNEDCITTIPEARLAILSDGIGGRAAGEVASRMAVETVAEQFTTQTSEATDALDNAHVQQVFLRSALLAHDRIRELADAKIDLSGMGTTLLAVYFGVDELTALHVGDSRLYRLRGGSLSQLNEDHTFASNRKLRTGYASGYLLRSIGTEDIFEPDLISSTIAAQDLYMLCSDGLSDLVPDNEIREILLSSSSGYEEKIKNLMEKALEYGSQDDISIVIVFIEKLSDTQPI